MAQETDSLPDIVVGRQTFPRAHPRVTDTVLDDPKHLPVGFGRWIRIKLRDARIEIGRAPETRFASVAVAT